MLTLYTLLCLPPLFFISSCSLRLFCFVLRDPCFRFLSLSCLSFVRNTLADEVALKIQETQDRDKKQAKVAENKAKDKPKQAERTQRRIEAAKQAKEEKERRKRKATTPTGLEPPLKRRPRKSALEVEESGLLLSPCYPCSTFFV